MFDEYVDETPIGDGGSPIVTLDIPHQEASVEQETAQQGSEMVDQTSPAQAEQSAEAQAQASKQDEKPADAEAAAATGEEDKAVEGKTPEQKASYWRGEHFKFKQTAEGQIEDLRTQLAEATATPSFLKLDKPPSEWDPSESLKEMPQAYRDKLRAHEFWTTLPDVLGDIDSQPANVQDKFFEVMDHVFKAKTGMSFEDLWNRVESSSSPSPTQTDAPQSSLVQMLRGRGIDDDSDPLMQAALREEARESRVRQLEAAQRQAVEQQNAFAQRQQAQIQREAEQAFETKKTAVWDNALKTFEGKVPQGKEFMLDFIKDRAESIVRGDTTAQNHLGKVKNFLLAASTPQEREQYERLASGSMAAYTARVAVAIQDAAKKLLGEIQEKEHLRSIVHQHQQTRRDIVPGQEVTPSGARDDILKNRINGNPDVAAEMAAAIYRSRRPS